jgi:butyrate kinase
MSSLKNDNKTNMILEAMAYQIAKEIASHYVTLDGEIDAIILSGKIFADKRFFKYISKKIENLAPINSYPKDYTVEALVYNVLQVVNGEKEIKTYA